MTSDIMDNRGMKPKDIRKAVQIIELYRDSIIIEWEKYHGENN